jgi:hypothetical protein
MDIRLMTDHELASEVSRAEAFCERAERRIESFGDPESPEDLKDLRELASDSLEDLDRAETHQRRRLAMSLHERLKFQVDRKDLRQKWDEMQAARLA